MLIKKSMIGSLNTVANRGTSSLASKNLNEKICFFLNKLYFRKTESLLFSMSDDDDRDWEDITEDFRLTAAELKIGVLIHDKTFTLHDGMTAVEMMHPQMDIGTTRAQTRPILRFLKHFC